MNKDYKTGINQNAAACHANQTKPGHYGWILFVYCLGLLTGGLYVGMIAPVRTVVQAQFGLDDSTGIWMINIYTLFYAALIPVIGKKADRYGRNFIFSICVMIFMAGAVICALSSYAGGFGLLLTGRVVQAAGAGGMIPVANAEIGTTFPPDKRGFALGIAAGVTDIANVLGAGVGSAVVGFAGQENWAVTFFIAVPVCIAVFAGSRVFLRSSVRSVPAKMDRSGSILLIILILFLLLGLKELDFFRLAGSIAQFKVWGPLAGAIVCAVVFFFAERRAEDPVFNMEFLESRPVIITMILSFLIGCVIVAMMLIPEYAEFIMDAPAGSGGYYMLILGVTSMVGPPLGGKLIDRFGPKKVLLFGLIVMTTGYCYLALFVSAAPSAPALISGLALVGLGMGFAMGAPTNYMILDNVGPEKSTSAIATITLIRQMGTTIAPAVYVGFISAGGGVKGYRQMLLCVAVFSLIAAAFTLFYKSSGNSSPEGHRSP